MTTPTSRAAAVVIAITAAALGRGLRTGDAEDGADGDTGGPLRPPVR